MTQLFQQSFFIFVAIGVLVIGVLFWLLIDIRLKWKKVFGKSGSSADRTGLPEGKLLEDLLRRVKLIEDKEALLESRVIELEGIGKMSVQRVGFLRFNPFSSTGGDQSFSLALLDGRNDGVVISSLYSREGTRMYAKVIKGGKAVQQLSEEERRVLEEALKQN